MSNIYTSDWHIHTEASYDAHLTFAELIKKTREFGITQFGVTDHVNFQYMERYHLKKSRELFEKNYVEGMHFGVELTPIPLDYHEYSLKGNYDFSTHNENGHIPGYMEIAFHGANDLVLVLTEEQIRKNKIEYVVCAAHWVWDIPKDDKEIIKSYEQQQMLCATDSRVDIIGHPWWVPWFPTWEKYFCDNNAKVTGLWFDDFNILPKSLHTEFASAAIENNKCIEMNTSFFQTDIYTEKFKHQYAEYMRMLFEMGARITIGTDAHKHYENPQISEKYLAYAGFKAGDFSEPTFREYN